MINVMVTKLNEEDIRNVEWQCFNHIDGSMEDFGVDTNDIWNLVREIQKKYPGVQLSTWINGNGEDQRWVHFILPEGLNKTQVRCNQYLILNQCMIFDKEKERMLYEDVYGNTTTQREQA